MSKYQDIMNKIEVTDEMKSRILQNIEKELAEPANGNSDSEGSRTEADNKGESGNKIRKFELRRYMPMVAALAVFIVSAFVVINVIPGKHGNYSSSPMSDSAIMTESATEMAAEESMEPQAVMEADEAAVEGAAPMEAAEPMMEAAEYAAEDNAAKTESAVTTSGTDSINAAAITQDQALEAIKKYCFANDPELESMMNSGDYTIYFDSSVNDDGEIVVLYRSYTAAQIRYYINPVSGEVYVTELVPGIIDEEQKTGESFNIRDYMN